MTRSETPDTERGNELEPGISDPSAPPVMPGRGDPSAPPVMPGRGDDPKAPKPEHGR